MLGTITLGHVERMLDVLWPDRPFELNDVARIDVEPGEVWVAYKQDASEHIYRTVDDIETVRRGVAQVYGGPIDHVMRITFVSGAYRVSLRTGLWLGDDPLRETLVGRIATD